MDEIVVPFPAPLRPATHLRASVIMVSLQGLTKHGVIDAYRRQLPEQAHAEIFSLAGNQWVPIEVAVTHYRTCDKIPITHEDRMAIGAYAAQRLQEGFLKMVVRISREAGATPWTALKRVREFTEQSFRGSGFEVRQRGPKDAYLTWREQPCLHTDQFAYGYVGLLTTLVKLYASAAYVKLDVSSRRDRSCGFELSWA